MGKKLLVADDSVTIQKVIKLALSSEGYDILAVSDGHEAIRAIQEERPDVVLIDVALPGGDAYQVKKTINADPRFASTGFLLLASAFERVDEKRVDEIGFHGRLIKPFDPSHLRKAVAELMAKLSGLGPAVAFAENAPMAPPPAPEDEQEDLPPVIDMHPTVAIEPAREEVSESELVVNPAGEPTVIISSAPDGPPKMTPPLSDEIDEVAATRSLENDIKDLTESTIKMSGLDEFQWNLDDSKKMKAPDASKIERTVEMPKPSTKDPVRNVISIPSKPIDDGGSNFPLKQSASPAPVTRAEIEAMVHRDVQAALEKMLRDVIPQIAETVIRKEIEKILAEP